MTLTLYEVFAREAAGDTDPTDPAKRSETTMSDPTEIRHVRKRGLRADKRFRARVAVDGMHSRQTSSDGKTLCGGAPTDRDMSREDAAGVLRLAPIADLPQCREQEFYKRVKEDAANLCPACAAAIGGGNHDPHR